MTTMQRRFAAWMLALAGSATLALAGGAQAQGADLDPPGRVARLAEVNGQVWIYSPDGGEWVSAARNQPLTTGDRLATDAGARAEMQIGSTSVRLDGSSELEVVQLDDEHVALDLHDGSAIARVRDPGGAGQLELTTDEGRFVALRTGTYRLDRNNGRSDITVYSGQARYEGPNSGLPVEAGQRAEFWIDSGGVAQYSTLSPINDAFAGWSNDRDRRFVGAVAERYVSPEMTGAAELDAYGRWEQTPDYGSVWIPTTVAVDWAPYSQGHWAWVRPWGWTWVDDAPWGFAPFHYGRWVYLRNNWCWTPGVRVARPVYAPALVGWVGGARGNVGHDRWRAGGGLVPARTARGLRAELSRQPALRAQRQHHQCHQRDRDQQRVRQSAGPARVREPALPACDHGRARQRDGRAPPGRPGRSAVPPDAGRARVRRSTRPHDSAARAAGRGTELSGARQRSARGEAAARCTTRCRRPARLCRSARVLAARS